VTGSPGAGKSTVVNALVKTLRQQDVRVGIIAVDPTSPFTGGALLGDRVRMRDLSGDPGVYIRSMASRGSLGGLARATASVIKVLDAAGFDYVLVETVGAGQAEVDIANAAHTTIVIEAPGMGDEIQSIKAGILEIADILVVNKADRPGADRTVRSLKMMLHLGPVGGTRQSGRISSLPPPAPTARPGTSRCWKRSPPRKRAWRRWPRCWSAHGPSAPEWRLAEAGKGAQLARGGRAAAAAVYGPVSGVGAAGAA
jgi:putative protein kinase ArgK-like GTPase of G3E family